MEEKPNKIMMFSESTSLIEALHSLGIVEDKHEREEEERALSFLSLWKSVSIEEEREDKETFYRRYVIYGKRLLSEIKRTMDQFEVLHKSGNPHLARYVDEAEQRYPGEDSSNQLTMKPEDVEAFLEHLRNDETRKDALIELFRTGVKVLGLAIVVHALSMPYLVFNPKEEEKDEEVIKLYAMAFGMCFWLKGLENLARSSEE